MRFISRRTTDFVFIFCFRPQCLRETGAIEPLKRLASGVVQQAARFAGQALRLIGEEVPLKLSPQVPLWTTHDVVRWMQQVTRGFCGQFCARPLTATVWHNRVH